MTSDEDALKLWLSEKPKPSQDMIRVMLLEGRRADLSTAEMVRAAEDALELFRAIHDRP